ncbi:MAG: PepSY domain-containing protein [Methyloglobulus sp.]|nr:PepSY domain-containing protein [Methyloglobulus sp.]
MDFIAEGDYSSLAIKAWMFDLHMAAIWGLLYKIFIGLMGLVVTLLSITGAYIWVKKRRAAIANQNKMTSR